jgi:hypothetical protein
MEDRVVFCDEMMRYDDEVLESIVFSDESRVTLGHDNEWVWYRRGEDNPSANVESIKFPKGLMVFAVIGLWYKSRLLIIDGTINAEKYIENCEMLNFIEELDERRGALNWIFQQDGATCHTTPTVIDWLESSCDVLQRWPANSPDLSPIELCWAILKKHVTLENPKTLDELRASLVRAWDSIPQHSINSLCKTFRMRLEKCRERNGQSISNNLWILCDRQSLNQYAMENRRPYQAWSTEEDQTLVELHVVYGPRWKLIACRLPGRTECMVKNRWHYALKKKEQERLNDTEYQLELRANARRHYPDLCRNVTAN